MLGELLQVVVTKLFEISDRLKQAEDEKRKRIANYFLQIEKCLRNSATQLKDGVVPHREWGALQSYTEDLRATISEEVGEDKAQELFILLQNTIKNTPTDDNDIPSIEAAAGKFKALAVTTISGKTEGKQPKKEERDPRSVLPSLIRRRTFISTAVGTSIGLTAGWLARQHMTAINPIRWKMTSFLGENAKDLILYKAPKMICERVKEITGEGFVIELNPIGEPATNKTLSDVHEGRNIQCSYSGVYYDDNYRALFFGFAIPFGLNPQEQTAWLYYRKELGDDKLTFMQTVYEKLNLNIISFPAAATGAQMGGWFTKKITKVEDLKGLKMRIPGLGADILREFGVKTDKDLLGRVIASNEIVERLRTGQLDAAEWTSPHDDLRLGIHRVADYYYYPGWWELSTTFDVQVNKSAWEKLPKEFKRAFQSACSETYMKILAEYDQKNSEALKYIETQGIRKIRFSLEIMKAVQLKTDEILDSIAKQDSVFAEVYTEWKAFKAQIKAWSKLGEI